MCGRWPAGSRFRPAAVGEVSPPSPAAALALVVLKGAAEVKVDGVTLGMAAPPGLAQLEWDTLTGVRPHPERLEKLPDWVTDTPGGPKVAEACEKFRKARADNPSAALEAFLRSADPVERRVALVTLGATDDLGRLGKVLAGAKDLDEWDFGVTVLRHWLGRCPGQDQALYGALQADGGMTPAHADQFYWPLAIDPDTAEDLKRPETYEVLIEYLAHDRPAIRNLAAWHLVRLVPQGKSIPYNPAGTAADAEAAYRAWKKLIPAGQLPPGKKD